jgi:hypothetical protein
MAETIEHRITSLMHEGIFILTVDGIKDLKGKNPLPQTSSSADKTPDITHNQLLGYFANRGAEYVFEKCWGSGIDLTTAYLPQDNTRVSAFNYGKRLGLFDDKTDHALFEDHAIVDDVQNKTHFFLMPHRMYLQDGKSKLE